MSVLSDLKNAFGTAVSGQFQEAKSEAQIIAGALAVWGVIITVQLGVLIWFASRKGK